MEIIRKEPNPSGAYSTPQNWDSNGIPEGYAVIAATVDMADFYAYNGFVTLTIEQVERTRQVSKIEIEDGKPVTKFVDEPYTIDTVTAYTPNVETWKEWKASLPEPKEPEPTTEERIAELEATNAELEDAMCEMDASNQAEIEELQETTSALEDAICEMDAANEERMAAIEDALCEMDMG